MQWCVTGKLAGLDKKLSRNLDAEVQMGSSPLELSKSPVGPLAESSRCEGGLLRSPGMRSAQPCMQPVCQYCEGVWDDNKTDDKDKHSFSW